jgi:hypothetical protein
MEPATTCMETKTSSCSLMKQLEIMSHLWIIKKLSPKKKGTILIKLKDESHQFIGDVYYIPLVKSNILSLGQLLKNR